ncbi:MAG: lipopolysaccharide biosynthesis protein [Oscillospiraceae bacterium]
MGSRSDNSIRNISIGTVKQLITLILAFASRTIFVRLLGAEYTGVNGLYGNILTVLSLAELGLGNVLTYSLYKPIKDNDTHKICALIAYFKKLYKYASYTILVLGAAFIPILRFVVKSDLPDDKLILYYILYLANTVMSYFAVYKSTIIQADQKGYIQSIVGTIAMIVQYTAQIVFLLATKSFIVYLIIQAVCTLGQNITLSIIADKMYPYLKFNKERNDTLIDRSSLLENLRSVFLYKIAAVLINNTDNILISVMLGTVFVGYYTNYFTLTSFMTTFIGLVVTGIMASLGDLNAEQNKERSYAVFRKLVFLFSIIICFCMTCYLMVVQDFIPIWLGSEYLLDYRIVLAMMFSFYISNIVNPVWMYRETMGLFSHICHTMLAAAALNLILSIILGKIYGMAGILGATGIARLLTIVWYEPKILFEKKFGEPIKKYVYQQLLYLVVNICSATFSCVVCRMFGNDIIGIILKICASTVCIASVYTLVLGKTEEYAWLKEKMIYFLFKKGRDEHNGENI